MHNVIMKAMMSDSIFKLSPPVFPTVLGHGYRNCKLLRGSYRGGLLHGSRTEKIANHGSQK